jgi:hypothetical protein
MKYQHLILLLIFSPSIQNEQTCERDVADNHQSCQQKSDILMKISVRFKLLKKFLNT